MFPQAENFENISVNVYETGSCTKLNERDPDTDLLNDIARSNFETLYFKLNEVKLYLQNTQYLEKLYLLHVNIRSIESNLENLRGLLEECEFTFNIICISETGCSNTKLQNNSNFSPMGFDSVPYKIRETGRRDGVLIFIKKNLSYKIRKDFSE